MLALAVACAAPRAGAPPDGRPSPDCAILRDETIRACITGFQLRQEHAEDEALERELAVGEVCPYAGAVAWSGCQRGAFRRFERRSELGPCGDRADYVESAIETSCMRPFDVPLGEWNDLVRRCFGWAEAGSKEYAASCLKGHAG